MDLGGAVRNERKDLATVDFVVSNESRFTFDAKGVSQRSVVRYGGREGSSDASPIG